ncbi:MAG: zf-HC2 domain-containing protein [Chloroflexota bacterium]
MSLNGGRGGRSDDWASDHARARARAAERLDGPLDPAEAAWLDGHLGSCARCAAVAADYSAQRHELRALRDREPLPPRDLWARTAAAIDRAPGGRARRGTSRSGRRPLALLAGALVVAIAVGTLTSSQWPFGGATPAPGTTAPPAIAAGSATPPAVAPTPLAVGPQDVAYLSVARDGTYRITRTRVDEVCPSEAPDCVSSKPRENSQPIGPLASPETVFGADGQPLIVVGSADDGSKVFAVLVPTQGPQPSGTPEPTDTPELTPTPAATETIAASFEPSGSPAETASEAPESPSLATATPPVTPEPSSPSPSLAAAKTVEIAEGLRVLDANAAYAPDGSAFAFTAEPADGSDGPDIYVWNVGDAAARAVTTDHRSVFGSWVGDDIVGSSVAASADGSAAASAIVVRNAAADPIPLPAAGAVWRPAVDPKGESAVYWSGSLATAPDGADWRTGDGRLVIGRWGDIATSAGATPRATAPAASEQVTARHETTIVDGPVADWDTRWDETGTRLAVWVADKDDPTIGKLSLYVVDPFDATIDLANPPLVDAPAQAGFSINGNRLAWAVPDDGSKEAGRVLILAWHGDDFGKVESAPGDFLLVR